MVPTATLVGPSFKRFASERPPRGFNAIDRWSSNTDRPLMELTAGGMFHDRYASRQVYADVKVDSLNSRSVMIGIFYCLFSRSPFSFLPIHFPLPNVFVRLLVLMSDGRHMFPLVE